MLVEIHGPEMKLDLGYGVGVVELHEPTGFGDVRCEHAGSVAGVLENRLHGFCVCQRDRLVYGIGRATHEVIDQVLAYARRIDGDVDADRLQVLTRADSRQHEQLRRVDSSTTQDHLARGIGNVSSRLVRVLHSDGPSLSKDHLNSVRSREHGQVGSGHRWFQERGGRALSTAVSLGHLVGSETGLTGVIEIVVVLKSRRHRRVDERLRQGVHRPKIGDAEAPTNAMKIAGTPLLIFECHECGKQVGITPARVAGSRPLVVGSSMTPLVDHGVHRGGTAEHLAPRPVQATVVEVGLRNRLVVPVVLTFEQLGEGCWDLGVDVSSRLPSLEQHHVRPSTR